MRKPNKQTITNNDFNFKVSNIYKTARKQQGTVKRRSFYIEETLVSPSEWATARMEGLETYVSNDSVKGNIPRLVHKRGFNKKGRPYLKGKDYTVKSLNDDFEDLVALDEILEIVPELV